MMTTEEDYNTIRPNLEITKDFVVALYWYRLGNSIYHLHLGRAVKTVKTIQDLNFILDLESYEPDAQERRELRQLNFEDANPVKQADGSVHIPMNSKWTIPALNALLQSKG